MASIVFNVPKHLDPMSWAPGVLFVANMPLRLGIGDYVYVCNRNRILYRTRYERGVWGEKVTTEGEVKGSGWKLQVGPPELPPREITRRCHTGFSYVDAELW